MLGQAVQPRSSPNRRSTVFQVREIVSGLDEWRAAAHGGVGRCACQSAERQKRICWPMTRIPDSSASIILDPILLWTKPYVAKALYISSAPCYIIFALNSTTATAFCMVRISEKATNLPNS